MRKMSMLQIKIKEITADVKRTDINKDLEQLKAQVQLEENSKMKQDGHKE